MKKFKKYKAYCKDQNAICEAIEIMEALGYKRYASKKVFIDRECSFFYFDEEGLITADISNGLEYEKYKESNYEEVNFCDLRNLTKKIVLKKREFDIKPFDRVLVRSRGADKWVGVLYSHIGNLGFICVDASYKYIAKYEGNENKLGTTEDIENSWSKEDIS